MAVAGALVVPVNRDCRQRLKKRLAEVHGVEVLGIGPKGIAVVIEERDSDVLKRVSEQINAWQEVMDFQLAYLNWEELERDDREEVETARIPGRPADSGHNDGREEK